MLNTRDSAEKLSAENKFHCKLALVDAATIAREELGRPITNTALLGALVKATGVVKPESMEEQLKVRFGKIAPQNINAFRRAYQETRIEE